ncbi:MAG TPA: hypothetical protein VE093_15005 [Polyangiaceae bacterium]|nr:hypothetical protein [Polyangiaceae bacterium]
MLSQQALDEVLELQKSDGRRLGSLLVERGLVNETQLTQILSHQLSVPWVALLHIEFSRQLLNLVPYEVAEKFCLVPIYVRHVRGQGDTLYVAMEDPTNDEPLRECTQYSGLPVRAMIAPPSDIREAIRVCYGIEIAPPHSRASFTKPPSQKPASSEARAPEPPRSVLAPLSPSSPSSLAPSTMSARSGPFATEANGPDTTPPTTPRVTPIEPRVASRPPVSVQEVQAAPSESVPSTSRSPDPRPRVSTPPPLPSRPSSPAAAAPPPPSSQPSRAAALPPPPSSQPQRAAAVDSEGPSVEAVEIEIPRSKRRPSDLSAEESGTPSQRGAPASRGAARKMMSLTLLDGTRLSVPAPPPSRSGPAPVGSSGLAGEAAEDASSSPDEAFAGQTEAPSEPTLTAQDVVDALRAAARGGDASQVLGENARWEAMFAALLSLLLRKHLIQEWELLEELKKL